MPRVCLGAMRVSKRDWYANGGFKNPLCFRRHVRGAWHYYIRTD